ncbi:renalase isoform X2 [Strongylocentrotus purpuratus]|uniref:Amine oxidase domain-containing protein n=1 Tax=Strongylocentrotus purpuratus TaxID=7668 RepID=A0A7M7HKP2_STRPU|nr:renalase isoform X2 [Strongylocentrotus purpuratus]
MFLNTQGKGSFVTPEYASKHSRYYKDLLEAGLIHSLSGKIEGIKGKYFNPETKNYVTPKGISSIVKHFIKKSGASLQVDHHLSRVDVEEESVGKPKLSVSAATASQTDSGYDAVVLTMPVPQILKQQGFTQQCLEKDSGLFEDLKAVQYSSRFALGLFYPPGVTIDVPYVGKYVDGNPCIRWVSVDNEKRGVDGKTHGPSVVVHTSVPFGIKHIDMAKSDVQPIIMNHLNDVIPNLPEPSSIKCVGWRYSQVSKPLAGAPGHVTIAEHPSYLLLAAGDGFSHSNFDGCIASAESALARLLEFHKKTSQL